MEVSEGLCEVGTKSVLTVTESVLGEEADEVEGNASGALWLDGERCTGGVGRGSQDGLLLAPLLAGGEGGASQFFVAVEQADEEFLRFGIKVLGKEAEVVFLAFRKLWNKVSVNRNVTIVVNTFVEFCKIVVKF